MTPLNKLLKIALPVTTVTSATILTAWLISRSPELLNQEQDKDLMLTDFEEPIEEFKEGLLSEASDGDESNKEDTVDEVAEEEETDKKSKSPEDVQEGAPDLNKLQEAIQKLPKDSLEKIPEASLSLPSGSNSDSIRASKIEQEEGTAFAEKGSEKPSDPSQGPDQKVHSDSAEDNLAEPLNQRVDSVESLEQPSVKEAEQLEEQAPSSPNSNSIVSIEEEAEDLREAVKEGGQVHEDPEELSSSVGSESDNESASHPVEEAGSEGKEASNPSKQGATETSSQEAQNQADEGSLDGNSDETKFDLSELTKWDKDLDSAYSGIDKLLAKF